MRRSSAILSSNKSKAMSGFYFIFWFIMSMIAAGLAVAAVIYLASLLRDIKQGLSRIESALASKDKAVKKKNGK